MSSENISQVHEPYRPPAATVAAAAVKSVSGGKSAAAYVADSRAVIVKLQSAYANKTANHPSDVNVQEIIKELQNTFYSSTGKISEGNPAHVQLADAKTAMQTLQSMMQENKKLVQIRAKNPQIDKYFMKMQSDLADGNLSGAKNTFLTIVKNLNALDSHSILVDTLT